MATIVTDDIFKYTFLKMIKFLLISLKCVTKSPTDNKPALVQVMAWRRTGNSSVTYIRLNLFDYYKIWRVPRQRHCRDACQISEQYKLYNSQPRGFET